MKFPLELRRVWVNEVCMELFVPEPAVVKQKYLQGEISFPYWSQIWPSAIALSRFLLSHEQFIQNKKVMELAAGLGLPSLVAARFAQAVVCSDYLTDAIKVINRSAAHNRLKNFTTALLDWHSLPSNLDADVLLLSDVNYDPAIFPLQLQMIKSFLERGAIIILGTPQRLMAKEFIEPLLAWSRHKTEISVKHQENEVTITVLVLQQS